MDGCSERAEWGKGLGAENLLGCVYVSVFIKLVMISDGSRHSGSWKLDAQFHEDKIEHVMPSFTPVFSLFCGYLMTPLCFSFCP